jgi:hypothetical protein
MKTNLSDNEKIVVNFLKMLEKQQSADEFDEFYHPNVKPIEFPNAILKNKITRNLEALKEGFEKGSKIMSKQEFEVQNTEWVSRKTYLDSLKEEKVIMTKK